MLTVYAAWTEGAVESDIAAIQAARDRKRSSARGTASAVGVRREIALGWQQLRSQGRLAGDTLLAHLSPAQSETIGLIGTITGLDTGTIAYSTVAYSPRRTVPGSARSVP